MTQAGVVDPLDLLDFTEYDGMSYQSPSISPAATTKSHFTSPSQLSSTPSTMPTSQTMPGPSHQYDQYKQQTPFVPGALASTMAVNQNNSLGYNLDFGDMSATDEMFDFNSASQPIKMDMDFEASPEASFFFPEPSTINPNATQALPSPPTVTSNVGRMYPGMHQQAAKAQAQQRQQQQQQQQRQAQPPKQQRAKGTPPTDPIVEQKISQLLNSMRSKPASADDEADSMVNMPRLKKDEDDMDEDERLLASEEGKKLSSKERRQLRNKVSARAFRSRRKGEYRMTSINHAERIHG
jgi:bZIP-type transcription factor MBZ1